MFDLLFDPNAWAALVTLTVLEIVLGIDNVVFISILVSRCDPKEAKRARQIGLSLALIFRIIMLFGLTWLMKLTQPVFSVFGLGFSWRDFILIGGGLFLIAKATHEIHNEVEARDHDVSAPSVATQSFFLVVLQLIAVDLIFSLDSIITAIGMAQDIEIMITAVCLAMIVMYVASGPVVGVHRRASDHQDAGARLPGADRNGACRRRLRGSRSARLHLLRHGVCRSGRDLQRARRPQSPAQGRRKADNRRR